MNSIFLFLHLSGATVIAAIIIFSFLSIFKNWNKYYFKLFSYLSIGLIFELITGTLLELTAPHPMLFQVFCSKILLYVGSVLATQAVLVFKMNKISIPVPYKMVAYSLMATLLSLGSVALIIR